MNANERWLVCYIDPRACTLQREAVSHYKPDPSRRAGALFERASEGASERAHERSERASARVYLYACARARTVVHAHPRLHTGGGRLSVVPASEGGFITSERPEMLPKRRHKAYIYGFIFN